MTLLGYGKAISGFLTAAALTLGVVSQADAQGLKNFRIEARGGIGVPVGQLSDVTDVGPTFGLKAAYFVHPRIALRADGDLEFLQGADDLASGVEAPNMRLLHYNGGIEAYLFRPGVQRWNIVANIGAGATTFDADQLRDMIGSPDFTETYPSVNGGIRLAYDVTPQVNLFAGGQAYAMFADEQDTEIFTSLSPEVESFGTVWSIPFTAGVTIQTSR